MIKYNKKEIMTHAWKLVKNQELTISQALKQAWVKAKSPAKPKLKDLGIDLEDLKILTPLNSTFIKETEKAECYRVGINQDFYNKYSKDIGTNVVVQNLWIPKSAIIELDCGTKVLAVWFAKKIGTLSAFCK